MSSHRTPLPALVWETELRLLRPPVLRTWAAAALASGLVMVLMLAPVFMVQRAWDALLPLAALVATAVAGLWLGGVLIMLVVYRGHLHVRYTLDAHGVCQQSLDAPARHAVPLGLALGVLTRHPQLLGSGLLARRCASETVAWSRVSRVDDDPRGQCLSLRNRWRTLLWLQCAPHNHAQVLERVRLEVARHRHGDAAASPLPAAVGMSLVVVAACVPLLLVVSRFGLPLLPVVLVMGFGLATVWLVPLCAWGVLAGLAWLLGALVLHLAAVRPSTLLPAQVVREAALLDATDIAVLLLLLAAVSGLVVLASRALRGRLPSVLMRDLG